MNKTILFWLSLLAALTLTAVNCTPEDPDTQKEREEETKPADLKAMKLTLDPVGDGIFDSSPQFSLKIENPNDVAVTEILKVVYKKDTKEVVATEEQAIEIPSNGLTMQINAKAGLNPGFYRASFMVGSASRGSVFGISPTKIVSAPDTVPGFNAFWNAAKAELTEVGLHFELTEITSRSSDARKIYLVELKSIPDTAGKEPIIVRGYYAEPQDGKKHPVIMHFYGYDDQKPTSIADCPYGGYSAEFAEFYLSTRGQMVNNRKASKRVPDGKGDFVNTYGDWFAYNFGHRDNYYYRGAFMDCVQAIRFMASRPTSDMNNLFAEGSSQGGALSYAAASLSDYPFTAIAPCVAFLGDFPDYFKIAGWPASTAKANQGSMTDAEMYEFLSYFDTKNLVTRIPASTAVIACSGLLDETCPPHTNLAPFNNLITTDKVYYFYPKMQHSIPGDWNNKITAFFEARIK